MPTDVYSLKVLSTDSDPSGSFTTTVGKITNVTKYDECIASKKPMRWKIPILFDFSSYSGESILANSDSDKLTELQEQVLFSIIDSGHNRVIAKYLMKLDVSSLVPELKAKATQARQE